MNATHDPALRSWVQSANEPGSDFPVQNLPFGVFSSEGRDTRVGVAIGDSIVDIRACLDEGLLSESPATTACLGTSLNQLMSLERIEVSRLRADLSSLLRENANAAARHNTILVPMSRAQMTLPAVIGDYTDFYASIHHATNVGSMFRPDNPLLPNYRHVPIGYHGRASSIVADGTPVQRPAGQTKADGDDAPTFGPSRRLDYELEVGVFVGSGNALGESIPLASAEDRLFGLCLVNDWSARDVQAWEYQPLGPF